MTIITRHFFAGRVRWGGSIRSDWWFYLRNNHELLALVKSHPEHPLHKCSRWGIVVASLAFSFLVSSSLALVYGCHACSHAKCGDCFLDARVQAEYPTWIPWQRSDRPIDFVDPQLMASIRMFVRGPCHFCYENSTILHTTDLNHYNRSHCYRPPRPFFRWAGSLFDIPNPCPSSYLIVDDYTDKITCPITRNMTDIHSDPDDDTTLAYLPSSPVSSVSSQQRRLLGFFVEDDKCTSSTEAQLVGYYLAVSVFAFFNLLFTSMLKSLGRCEGAYCSKDRCKHRKCCACCVYFFCKSMGHLMLWFCFGISLTFGFAGALVMFAARTDWDTGLRLLAVNKISSWFMGIGYESFFFYVRYRCCDNDDKWPSPATHVYDNKGLPSLRGNVQGNDHSNNNSSSDIIGGSSRSTALDTFAAAGNTPTSHNSGNANGGQRVALLSSASMNDITTPRSNSRALAMVIARGGATMDGSSLPREELMIPLLPPHHDHDDDQGMIHNDSHDALLPSSIAAVTATAEVPSNDAPGLLVPSISTRAEDHMYL